jgi:hypothetical protein
MRSATARPRAAASLVGLPLALVVCACVPGLNAVVFSGHGGPGWFLLWLSFPLLVVNSYRLLVRPAQGARVRRWISAAAMCVGYWLLAYPIGDFAQQRISSYSGLAIENHAFYRGMTFPVGFLVPRP